MHAYHVHRVLLIVRLFFCFVVFVSFMLQFYVPMDFLEPIVYEKILKLYILEHRFPRHHRVLRLLIETVFRVSVVLIIGQHVIS